MEELLQSMGVRTAHILSCAMEAHRRKRQSQSAARVVPFCSAIYIHMLFLSNSVERATQLCQLIEEMRPSSFIWVTDQERMFRQGLADRIWTAGGNRDRSLETILNEEMRRPSPILPLKR